MKQLLYATTNKAKFSAMERAVKPLGINIIGLDDLDCKNPIINETGKTPLENAQIKARAYYESFHMPVFSCDSGLYFDELEERMQPGVHVRRVDGRELSDDEMIQYYSSLAKQYGGKLTGRYRNAICLILSESMAYSSMDISLAGKPFALVSTPHKKRVKGFPLDSLSKDIISGEYYYDLSSRDVSTSMEQGFKMFFAKVISDSDGR